MNGLVTIASEPTGNAREFDINERIASFPTIYDTLWLKRGNRRFSVVM